MQRSPFVAAALLLAATVAWSLVAVFGAGPLEVTPAALLAADLLVAGTVVAVGLALVRGLWTRRAALVLLAAQAGVGIAYEVDGWWIGAVALGAMAFAALAGPGPVQWLRKLPPAEGPSPDAVFLTLGLLLLPGVVAITAPQTIPVAGWVLVGLSVAAAWAYARAWLPALWALRVGLPAAGVAAVAPLDWWGIVLLGISVALLTALAWAPDVRRAMGSAGVTRVDLFPIPPELAPGDVLHAAGLDERGRPQTMDES